LQCGLLRSNFSFAICLALSVFSRDVASYVSTTKSSCRDVACYVSISKTLERETGIEPATNSLEGCDSTTELLPP
jgi:hypothetical protein